MSGVRQVIGKVKNRAPAPIQITAEQILTEAKARQDDQFKEPKQHISDAEELAMHKLSKRKEFEDSIRRQRMHIGTWVKYAQWEASHHDFERARSVFERALDVDEYNTTLWFAYADMEMKNEFINHARNVWDRAVALLPRVDQLWYRYTYMEDMIGNVKGCRGVFERWMRWEPNAKAWATYVNFEERGNNLELARKVYERYCVCHPVERTYIRFAKWEERHQQMTRARGVYEKALKDLPAEEESTAIYIAFAKFEERCHEYSRARVLYKYALDKFPKHLAADLYKEFISFEKQYGDRRGIEDVIVNKRRFQYESQVKEDPHNYDAWFDYIRLEEGLGEANFDKTRDVYERAIANLPPVQEKKYWKRYIYLWINYALFEELETKDYNTCRQVYRQCLSVIPHKRFTFAKIWVMFAHFEVRRKDLGAARRVLGQAIGRCPKDQIFKQYIQLELNLVNVDRCRTLYGKYLAWAPHNCLAWTRYAQLETSVNEIERARALYELAVNQQLLDMPELLWKSYIDFEISQNAFDKARVLYERLLERTAHVKVFISFAQFEATSAGDTEAAREVFDRAYKALKEADQREECVMLLEAWEGFEQSQRGSSADGNAANIAHVAKLMPKKVVKKRKIELEDGSIGGWEEYYDYVFPDDEKAASGLAFLEKAMAWKKKLALAAANQENEASEAPTPTTATGNKRKADGELSEEEEQGDEDGASAAGSKNADGDDGDDDDDDDDEIDLGDL